MFFFIMCCVFLHHVKNAAKWSLHRRLHNYVCTLTKTKCGLYILPVDTADGAGPSVAKKSMAVSPCPLEIVFSFDTTASMHPCLNQVQYSDSNAACVHV